MDFIVMSWRINEMIEKLSRSIARLLPKKIVYFCVIRVWAHATTHHYANKEPDNITWGEALKSWESAEL